MHGSGSSVRSYLYVTDVANAYILVLHKGTIGETYNIGTQKVRNAVTSSLSGTEGEPVLVQCPSGFIPVQIPVISTTDRCPALDKRNTNFLYSPIPIAWTLHFPAKWD